MRTVELHANVNNKKKNTVAINYFMTNSCRRKETIKRTSIFVLSSPYSCPIFQTWTFSTDFHKNPPISKLAELFTVSRAGIGGGFSKSFRTSFFLIYLLRTSKTNYITFLHIHPALRCNFPSILSTF